MQRNGGRAEDAVGITDWNQAIGLVTAVVAEWLLVENAEQPFRTGTGGGIKRGVQSQFDVEVAATLEQVVPAE